MNRHHPWISLYEAIIGFNKPKGRWFPMVLLIVAVMTSYLLSLSNRFSPEDEALAQTELVTKKVDLTHYFGSVSRRVEWGGVTYRPLTMLSLAADYHKKGLDYVQFLRVNALLHMATAWLVFWLALKLTRR